MSASRDPGWIFTNYLKPTADEEPPWVESPVYGEALFQQAERLCLVARQAGLDGVQRLFGPDCWGYPREEAPWWTPDAATALITALIAALRAASTNPEDADDKAVIGELLLLLESLEVARSEGYLFQLNVLERDFFG